jgi:predicted outer membrane repeat protein
MKIGEMMKKKAMLILFMILMTGAFAITIYIPADYPTIQEGIDASADGDEIIVAPGTYLENINFAGKAVILGSLFYTTQDTSYIPQTIIDGNQADSVVRFDSGEDSTSVFTGFTITNGQANHGGGIYCRYSSPNLENVMITDNSAEYDGGGICCRSNASPSLENVMIRNNFAEYGGGIYIYESSPNLENVTIRENSAEYGGGGISCWNSNPSLDNVKITGNSAADEYGGGIYCHESSPSLENVMITGNSAEYEGGGIICFGSSPSFANVTIRDNYAEARGGGISCWNSSPVFSSENRCNIYLNNTNNRGNGSDIYSDSNISVIVDTFTVSNPTDFHAAPIENFTFDILHGLQDQISADLYVSPDGNNTNTGLTIDEPLKTIQYACSVILADSQNLHTIHLAGGTYSPSTNSEFFPVDIPGYVSLCGVSEIGVILDAEETTGVIRLFNTENVTISDLTITNGYASSGGGIYCEASSPSLENVTITENYAEYNGGGIYCDDYSSPSLINVTITHNSADVRGGGIYCFSSDPILTNVSVSDNSAESMGGGICCTNYSSPVLENVTIRENSTYYRGGGIYCNEYSSPSLANVTITGNLANDHGGGIYCANNSSPILENVTLTENSSDHGGGIFCVANSNPSLVNCILWNDSPQEVEFSGEHNPNTITIAYSDIEGGEEGIVTNNNGTVNWLAGNIDADPLFVDAEIGNYQLTENSPCIDTGIAFFEYDGEVLVDLSEDEYWGIAPDMGAYEYGLVATDEFVIQNSKLKIQNFPNPFNPETNILFELKADSNVLIEIYNIKGQKVTTLVNESFEVGSHIVTWNAADQSSGIYLLRFNTAKKSEVKKLVLLK